MTRHHSPKSNDRHRLTPAVCAGCGVSFETRVSGPVLHCSQSCATSHRWRRHRESIRERILASRNITPSGCWEWTRSLSVAGYGQTSYNLRTTTGKLRPSLVHRVAYELFKGEIPAGLELDHLCRNRKCFNPDHLEAVTHQENMIRGWRAVLADRAAQRLKEQVNGPVA